jgi:uroporphyrinogen decarboxylase
MAEPAAGLLSPRMLSTFSSQYVQAIATPVQDGTFEIILHNCAAKLIHLPSILETGLKAFHFGVPMDLPTALAKVPSDVILCGNLDPAQVFVRSSPTEVAARTTQLLAATSSYRNFVLSSGCDLPPLTPLANLDAFHQAIAGETARADWHGA